MAIQRGMMGPGHQLQDTINQILLQSPVDDIVVPEKTSTADMAWMFPNAEQPTRIFDCSRDQFLMIIQALTDEICKIQKQSEKLSAVYLSANTVGGDKVALR
jgi:hypothetical protein